MGEWQYRHSTKIKHTSKAKNLHRIYKERAKTHYSDEFQVRIQGKPYDCGFSPTQGLGMKGERGKEGVLQRYKGEVLLQSISNVNLMELREFETKRHANSILYFLRVCVTWHHQDIAGKEAAAPRPQSSLPGVRKADYLNSLDSNRLLLSLLLIAGVL